MKTLDTTTFDQDLRDQMHKLMGQIRIMEDNGGCGVFVYCERYDPTVLPLIAYLLGAPVVENRGT